MTNRIYNYKFSEQDNRDFKMTLDHSVSLPTKKDLREKPYFPPVLDQGNLGSCVSNATATAIHFALGKQNMEIFDVSRLYMYYTTRVFIEKTDPRDDSGVSLRDMCKAIKKYRVCREEWWPYDVDTFSTKPDALARRKAQIHKGFVYKLVDNTNLHHIKLTLAKGYPIIIGVRLYDSFETDEVAQTGVVPMPNLKREQCLGGHCMCLVSYDDATQRFGVCNSWSDSWGDNGFCYMPYEYLTNPKIASDFWVVSFFS